ncbi:MAG TPA: lysylphosphatidylglycerol synthase transmembrane domain-containing protein [Luteolibacter sp.]|nr:lysylphosphatidylglycerol synthase transmembrane domain-containing protein [Luteolibacter sp.]
MNGSRGKTWGRRAFLAIQIIISGLLAWWIIRRPGFAESFANAWQNIHPGWLVAGVLVAGASIAAHIWRWWICLRLLGITVRWTRLAGVFLASTFIGTFVIGGLGGDAARVLMLTRQFPGNASKLMVSVVADRLCGLISLIIPALIFTLPAGAILSTTPVGKAAVHFLWGYLFFSSLLFAFCWFCGTEKARLWLPKWAPARDWMLHVSDCFEMLRPTGFRLFAAVGASILMVAFHFATFWCIAKGCGANVSLAEINTVMPVIDAATTVPATPGGLGMREELFVNQLGTLAGTPSGHAVLISLAGFLCGLLWCIPGAMAAASLLPKSIRNPEHASSGNAA